MHTLSFKTRLPGCIPSNLLRHKPRIQAQRWRSALLRPAAMVSFADASRSKRPNAVSESAAYDPPTEFRPVRAKAVNGLSTSALPLSRALVYYGHHWPLRSRY